MAQEQKVQKPRPWRPRKDPKACIACEQAFRRGDQLLEAGGACIHAGCVKLYRKQCKELGIGPPCGRVADGELAERRTCRRMVNVTRGCSSGWHVDGPWPTREYLLAPEPRLRFAGEGDTVEFVEVSVLVYDYRGLRYEVATPLVVGSITL